MISMTEASLKLASKLNKGTVSTWLKKTMQKADAHVRGEEKAQGIMEYGLILALVGLALLGGITGLKNSIQKQLQGATNSINQMGNSK